MISSRFLDAGSYYDPVSGILVRLTWDQRDECWRLWKRVHLQWAQVPGENLGTDTTEAGVDAAVKRTLDTYEAMIDADARKRAGLG